MIASLGYSFRSMLANTRDGPTTTQSWTSSSFANRMLRCHCTVFVICSCSREAMSLAPVNLIFSIDQGPRLIMARTPLYQVTITHGTPSNVRNDFYTRFTKLCARKSGFHLYCGRAHQTAMERGRHWQTQCSARVSFGLDNGTGIFNAL